MSGEQPFALVPFGGEPAEAGLRLGGRIGRERERLWVAYCLTGPLPSLAIPPLAATPRRRDELWQATCLELFLALPGQEGYREFNLSPSGDWNVYRLDGYRQGLRPDPAWTALPLRRRDPNPEAGADAALEIHLSTTLPPELAAAHELEAAVTAVLQLQDGSCRYWALRHPGEEADFHRRDGFALRL
ncbi:MAG: DOMON-like domain-containing protein [Synechococcaceae cyanobacterium]